MFLQQQQFKFVEHPLNNINETNQNAVKASTTQSQNTTFSINQRRRNYTTSTSALSTVSATTVATNEYLMNFEPELCFTALEFVLTLLASQSLLALKDINLSQREKQLIKRELSTELSVFHDFVKKRVLSEIARDDPLRRKKHGFRTMSKDHSDELSRHEPSGSTRRSVSNSDRMRINVMRKNYLTSQKSPSTSSPTTSTPFNMTHQYSPIASTTSGAPSRNDIFDLPSSTPAQLYSRGATTDENDGHQDQLNVQLYFEPEDPTFCELSFIQLVEEDYLHFLSNLFSYICHTEKIN